MGAWHHHHHIRGKSFWSLSEYVRDSWNWKCLLRLRPLDESFIKCKLGNGRKASFWFDNWSCFGPLIKFIGEEGPREFQIPLQATVAAALDHVYWNISAPSSAQGIALFAHLSNDMPPLIETEDDLYSWVVQNTSYQFFNTAKTWDDLRPKTTTKDWFDFVWFKGATPKHAFTMWVSQLNRLPTRVRLASWGMSIPTTCCLCSDFDETRDHLLLRCAFSDQIWRFIQVILRLPPCIFYTWAALIAWTRLKSDSAPPILRKLAAQAAVYHIWKQRNNVLHNNANLSALTIFKDIDREVRNTISARRTRKHFRDLMILWIR